MKDLREDKDLLQIDIAKLLKTSQVQYSRYETGLRYMPIYHLKTLAEFYDTSIDYIIGLTNKKEPYPRIKEEKKS
ncbi:MAG: helix-turn-helix transcriptional regulator [Bacilli bacterium]|nr:helix-turn-helix transcriptional regulator [Bacilli bacterium]